MEELGEPTKENKGDGGGFRRYTRACQVSVMFTRCCAAVTERQALTIPFLLSPSQTSFVADLRSQATMRQQNGQISTLP